jgi:hypothetical protein
MRVEVLGEEERGAAGNDAHCRRDTGAGVGVPEIARPQWSSGERVQFRAGDRGAHTAVTITGERARAWRDFGGNEGR